MLYPALLFMQFLSCLLSARKYTPTAAANTLAAFVQGYSSGPVNQSPLFGPEAKLSPLCLKLGQFLSDSSVRRTPQECMAWGSVLALRELDLRRILITAAFLALGRRQRRAK